MKIYIKLFALAIFLFFCSTVQAGQNDTMYVYLTATVHHNKAGTDRSNFYSPVFKTTREKLLASRDRWSKHYRKLCGSSQFRGKGSYHAYADHDYVVKDRKRAMVAMKSSRGVRAVKTNPWTPSDG